MLPGLLGNPNLSRSDIIERLKQAADVTHSTAVSYYERIAKELGFTGKERKQSSRDSSDRSSSVSPQSFKSSSSKPSTSPNTLQPSNAHTSSTSGGNVKSVDHPLFPDRELEGMDSEDPNRIGVIRRIKGAHLVYKRQMPDSSFEELWIYKLDPDNHSIHIKQAILAGTDIPVRGTTSPDGVQKYQLKTLGDAQLLHIIGLPN